MTQAKKKFILYIILKYLPKQHVETLKANEFY